MIAAAVIVGFLALILLYRMRRFFGAAVISAVGGLATIGLINLSGLLTGIMLPFNLFSLLVAGVLGAPGIISLLLMQMFW